MDVQPEAKQTADSDSTDLSPLTNLTDMEQLPETPATWPAARLFFQDIDRMQSARWKTEALPN